MPSDLPISSVVVYTPRPKGNRQASTATAGGFPVAPLRRCQRPKNGSCEHFFIGPAHCPAYGPAYRGSFEIESQCTRRWRCGYWA